MRALALCACLVALASAARAQEPERPSRAVPQLPRAPKLDGQLQDFTSPLTLEPSALQGASASFTARVGWRKDTLYVGMELQDDALQAGDLAALSLFFPEAGPTAAGHVFRFGFDGKRASPGGTPGFAQQRVEVGVQRRGNQLWLEVAIPTRAFPRFPAQAPLVLELCLTYEDTDGAGAVSQQTNCQGGSMQGEALRLPEEFRKGLKLKPPQDINALEAHPAGWLGYALLPTPDWVQADEPLTRERLLALVAPDAVKAEEAGVNVPETLSLPDGRPLLAVLTGRNPYSEGRCDAEQELRLGLYLVKERTARRVLEWPVANCTLGQASSVELDEEGALSIGYSNGAMKNFAWSGERFERTEIGKR